MNPQQGIYLLITCDVGKTEDVKQELEGLSEVKEVQQTLGVYDVIAKAEGPDKVSTRQTIGKKIRGLNNVRSVLTLVFGYRGKDQGGVLN